MKELAIAAGIRLVLVFGTLAAAACVSRCAKGGRAYVLLILVVTGISWLTWTSSRQWQEQEAATAAEILWSVGIRRPFSAEDLKKTRRAMHLELHPDLQTSSKQQQSLEEFQRKERQLELLGDPVKRELLDRFSFPAHKSSLDQDLLRELNSNLTMIELTNLLPKSSPWLVCVGLAILKAPPHAAKPLLNLLVLKFLWELYLLVLQPITAADLMDLVTPFTTLAQRRELIDFIFVVPFSLVLFALVFSKQTSSNPQIDSELPEAPKLQELLHTLGVSFKVKAN